MICLYLIANEESTPADYMLFDTKLANFIQGVTGDLWEFFLDENSRGKRNLSALSEEDLAKRRNANITDLSFIILSLQNNWGRMISNEFDENIKLLGEALYRLTTFRNNLASALYKDCYVRVFTKVHPAGVGGFDTIVQQYTELAESLAGAKTQTELRLAVQVFDANYEKATKLHAAIELVLKNGGDALIRSGQPAKTEGKIHTFTHPKPTGFCDEETKA